MVVVGKFVHSCMQGGHMKSTHMVLHSSDKGITVSKQILSVLITVFLHTGQEPGQWFHECIIVHDSIPFVTHQPAFRITVMLCQNDRIRVGCLDCLTEIFPELMVKLIAMA